MKKITILSLLICVLFSGSAKASSLEARFAIEKKNAESMQLQHKKATEQLQSLRDGMMIRAGRVSMMQELVEDERKKKKEAEKDKKKEGLKDKIKKAFSGAKDVEDSKDADKKDE